MESLQQKKAPKPPHQILVKLLTGAPRWNLQLLLQIEEEAESEGNKEVILQKEGNMKSGKKLIYNDCKSDQDGRVQDKGLYLKIRAFWPAQPA